MKNTQIALLTLSFCSISSLFSAQLQQKIKLNRAAQELVNVELCRAIKNNDIQAALHALENQAQIGAEVEYGDIVGTSDSFASMYSDYMPRSALELAADKKTTTLLKILFENHRKLNPKKADFEDILFDSFFENIFMKAYMAKKQNHMKLLLAYGMPFHNLSGRSYYNNLNSILFEMIKKRDIGEIKLMVSLGADLTTKLPRISEPLKNAYDHAQNDPLILQAFEEGKEIFAQRQKTYAESCHNEVHHAIDNNDCAGQTFPKDLSAIITDYAWQEMPRTFGGLLELEEEAAEETTPKEQSSSCTVS